MERSINYSRSKGIRYELKVIELLKIKGYEAVSSRAESRNLDAQQVDIVTNAPFHIQCKSVQRMKTSYHKILKEMNDDKTPVIFHHKLNEGSVVVMRSSDFEKLLL